MKEKRRFEPPKIETFRRDELIVETAFTGVVMKSPVFRD